MSLVVLIILIAHLHLNHAYQSKMKGCFKTNLYTKSQTTYKGPLSSFDEMVAGCEIDDLGLTIMVGPSKSKLGMGLFAAINSRVSSVDVPLGTPICGYSRGEFKSEAEGDKAVAYYLDSPYAGIIYNKTLMPLYDALGQCVKGDMRDALLGHTLLFDSNDNNLLIEPDPTYNQRYFIPDEATDVSVKNLGIYANDFAFTYNQTDNAEKYNLLSDKNVLSLVWRLDFDPTNKRLFPLWPVLITRKDLRFKNKIPMELGLHYSWRYWEAAINS